MCSLHTVLINPARVLDGDFISIKMWEMQNGFQDFDFEQACRGDEYCKTRFSSVYRLEIYPRPVAVKQMKLQGTILKDERIIREQNVLESIKNDPSRSEFVITPLSSSLSDEYAYLAFPWAPASLADFNKEKRYSDKTYKRILYQLALALQYLHAKSIIHRDVKPSNILLTSPDLSLAQVRLADFGFSRIIDLQESDLSLTRGIGTPAYAAPEIVYRNNTYDEKVDVWSYGAVAYELMSGKKPFTGKSLLELGEGQKKELDFTGEIRGGRKEECQGFIKFCLDIIPENRPSMSDILKHGFFSREQEPAPI